MIKPRITFNRTLNLWVCSDDKPCFSIFYGMGKTPNEAYINFRNRKFYINTGVGNINYF